MSEESETFFTSVGCMDGRVQIPILELGQKLFNVQHADTITEAGLVKLVHDNLDQKLLNNLKDKIVNVSVKKHKSKGIIVHGHQNCAGNPVDDMEHKKHIVKTAHNISAMLKKENINLDVIPVFIKKSPHGWVHEIVN